MPPEPLGVTFYVPPGQAATGVYEDVNGVEVFETNEPYLLSDGVSLQPPLPVFDAGGPTFLTAGGTVQKALAVNGLIPAYDPAADALFSRMTVEPDATRKGLINDLIVALKDAAVWEKFDALYLIAAHDAQAARLNWVADEFNLNAMNSPVFTADQGYHGDGASAYLSTGFNPASAASPVYALDDAHVSIWSRTDNQSDGRVPVGARTSSSLAQALMIPRTTSNGFVPRINQDAAGASVANANSSGHLLMTRSGGGLKEVYRNGVSLGQTTEASTAVPGAAFNILAANTGGVASNHDNRQLASISIGGSLTIQNVADLHAALNAYMQAIGAAA